MPPPLETAAAGCILLSGCPSTTWFWLNPRYVKVRNRDISNICVLYLMFNHPSKFCGNSLSSFFLRNPADKTTSLQTDVGGNITSSVEVKIQADRRDVRSKNECLTVFCYQVFIAAGGGVIDHRAPLWLLLLRIQIWQPSAVGFGDQQLITGCQRGSPLWSLLSGLK